jgi:hypothetical protein
MKKKILTFLAVLSSLTMYGQTNATTDNGKQVKLYPNGTWEYVYEETTYRPTSSVFVGGKKLLAGERTVVHTERNGITTSISIAKDGDITMIIFWQESTNYQMNFFNWLWTGTVMLYLENGETISLMDRNMKGQNKISNGYTSPYGTKSDLFQRYSAHYLTPAECIKLKKSNLSQVAYRTTSSFDEGTTYLEITDNFDTIKEQLLAIKR